MKTLLKTFVILFFILTTGSFAQDSLKLVGTWELVSYQYTLPDTVITGSTTNFTSIKIVTPLFFAYVGQTLPSKEFKRAGAGRYIVKNDLLQEFVMFSSIKNMLGKTFKYKCVIEGDKWYHSGQINEIFIEEIWKKVE